MAQVAGTNTELDKLAAKYGIDMSTLGGGGAVQSSSPPVFFGETNTREYRASGPNADVLQQRGGNKYGGKATQIKSLEEANSAFYQLDQAQLVEFQRRLIASGAVDPKRVRVGDYDDVTYDAFSAINERAAKFYAVGRNLTPNDVLGMIERAGSTTGTAEDREARRAALEASFGTRVNEYKSSDPAGVRQTAEAAFQQALGRKPKKDELQKFVSSFLGAERGEQARGFAFSDQMAATDRERALQSFDAQDPKASAAPVDESGMSETQVLMARLQRFIADAPGKITLGKTTRSYEEQVRLWNNYKSGKGPLAAKPGTSKHSDGRANDLTYENDKVRQWVLANASKYGLAFPVYDPKKSRSKDEAWHVEVMTGPGLGRGNAAPPSGPGPAPVSVDYNSQDIDMGARAQEFAEQENPVEKRAYDIGGQFSNLLGILTRGVV